MIASFVSLTKYFFLFIKILQSVYKKNIFSNGFFFILTDNKTSIQSVVGCIGQSSLNYKLTGVKSSLWVYRQCLDRKYMHIILWGLFVILRRYKLVIKMNNFCIKQRIPILETLYNKVDFSKVTTKIGEWSDRLGTPPPPPPSLPPSLLRSLSPLSPPLFLIPSISPRSLSI